jgi:hypothetical protein
MIMFICELPGDAGIESTVWLCRVDVRITTPETFHDQTVSYSTWSGDGGLDAIQR